MQLTVSKHVDTTANIIVVAPVGRIDQSSAETFLNSIQEVLAGFGSNTSALVLDFSGVDYIASVGLRALMVASRQAKSIECKIGIAALQPMVQEVFNIARFDLVIACFDTLESASREFSACK